jgi:quercetin dioxygenase-like cupin family protein
LTNPSSSGILMVNHIDHLEASMPVLTAPDRPTHELPGTRFTALVGPSRGALGTSVWRVEILPGTQATEHSVTREEVFVLLSGQARVMLPDGEQQAGAGDAIVIPADTPFALSCHGDQPLVALCLLPVGGQAVLPGAEPFTPPWAE